MLEAARLRWRFVLLFVLMVLLPALVFSVLIVRAVRSERIGVAHEKTERQRQIVRLVETDLNQWLFSTGADSALARAPIRFRLQGDRVVFPAFQLSLPLNVPARPRPAEPTPSPTEPTAESIADFYYPRILTFLRDFRSGAQYFLRLRALIVRLPGSEEGYVLGAQQVLDHVNARLAELTAAANLSAELWIGDLRDDRPLPATGAFGMEGFSFFQVIFHDVEPARAIFGRHAFAYSMALLLLVTIFGSVIMYRVVSQDLRLSQLRSDFVSAVSHEFRSPLSSILALAERLESARVRDPDKLAEYHRVIGRDARRLSALVTRLLDFAQIEGGRKSYSLEPVELISAAREAIHACHDSVRHDRIQFAGAPGPPLWVQADRTALLHCIQNLIENAAKYSPPDSPIAVACASSDGSHVIDVRDRGIGIAIAEQPRIFEKFYRGREATELGVPGVGIGLALVKHVMERHGGSVTVESRPGEGSRFRLSLPAAEV